MALLWALRSVSGRNLPIIIDTPMGRLDSEHRHALLTRFFPEAANQVILLSTDTEIDAVAYHLLQPAISHTFSLDFDNESGSTVVKQGYFGVNGLAEEPMTKPSMAVPA
jgi:DNA sulfur modification protein DndD